MTGAIWNVVNGRLMALLGPEEMSELSPLSGLKRTFDQLALT